MDPYSDCSMTVVVKLLVLLLLFCVCCAKVHLGLKTIPSLLTTRKDKAPNREVTLSVDSVPANCNVIDLRGGESTVEALLRGFVSTMSQVLQPLLPSSVLKYFGLQKKARYTTKLKKKLSSETSKINAPHSSTMPGASRLKNVLYIYIIVTILIFNTDYSFIYI